ncbi:MAG: carboxymuconolactone decarboxylase family protein [Betaproteobacteria bacterium]|nr:MAG: carboxymuconolactone decarboxylase family protein [Betaproteobacteria bacterium]
MSESEWVVGQLVFQQRMPPLPAGKMTDAQRKAADEMIAGPRKGVKGPFVPLLRCPELMDRLQKVGEYLRFQSSLDQRISEFVILVVSRAWTQHFEWFVHVPLGRKAGISEDTIAALADGRRPSGMSEDEDLAYDFCDELLRNKGVSETTYRRVVMRFGENGVIDMLGVAGYFTTVSMIMNVAHSPPPADESVAPLVPYPL